MTERKTLNEMANDVFLANKEKGFWDKERNVGEMLMLVTSELGEAMEAHRKGKFTINTIKNSNDKKNLNFNNELDKLLFEGCVKDTFEDEIADSIIRLFDMAGGLNIDLDFHIKNKLAYNATRERLHGKKY